VSAVGITVAIMRLLHTSDWHLGRGLHGLDLHDAQRQFISQIVHTVREHDVDAVLIAGDVFDRAIPPVPAVKLWAQALRELSALVPVIAISGNHDSAIRLGAASDLYREGVHLCTLIDQVGTPIVLADEHGPVAVYPIPFLDPDIARHALSDSDEPLARSHAAVLGQAMQQVRTDLSARTASDPATRSVVMAHAFVIAGTPPVTSESERDIRVGGVDSVPSAVFDGVDYVALGHLHGAQRVDGEQVRYSGSPLRYSFSETRQRKQVTLVELDANGLAEVTSVELTQPREMAIVRDTLDQLLTAEAYDRNVDDWVQVAVIDDERPADLKRRVSERFPHALSIRHEPASGPLASHTASHVRVPSAPDEVAASFVHYVTGGQITEAELAAFTEAYEFARTEQVGA
jgi:exonuclease SbcD